jgi:hypothetical protein
MAAAMWVRLTTGAEIGMGRIADVSVSGAFLETALKLPVNANITLEPVSTAGVALEGLKVAARVARVSPRGLGLEWRVMATPQTLALLGAVAPPPPISWPTGP